MSIDFDISAGHIDIEMYHDRQDNVKSILKRRLAKIIRFLGVPILPLRRSIQLSQHRQNQNNANNNRRDAHNLNPTIPLRRSVPVLPGRSEGSCT